MIDSGADGSMIPRGVVEILQLIPFTLVPTRDFQGNDTGDKAVYRVTISLGTFDFSISMVETDGRAIIGRDILNQLTTTLKGREEELEISR